MNSPAPTFPPTFTTARLRARPPTGADAEAAFRAYAGDPEVTRYLSWATYRDVEPLRLFLAEAGERWRTGGGHRPWLLHRLEDDALVGSIGISIEPGKVMCGYVFGRAYWGRGYATEALRAVVDHAIDQPGVQRVWAFCDVDNPASARVMEKAGMAREGVLRRWHGAPNLGPGLRDCIVCAKVR